MVSETLLSGLGALLLAAVLTGAVYRAARTGRMLDVPNLRSSHTTATPRGGGIAIVAAATLGLLVLALLGRISYELLLALVAGGGAVGAIGLADDKYGLPAGLRLTVHVLAAAWAVYWLGGLTGIRIGGHAAQLGLAGNLLAVLGIVWFLNLFNFMDGIDGIAASEGIFIALAGAALSLAGYGVAPAALVIAASCAGFLWWNWPPAKIFMGDVGSGYLGYVIAVLGLQAARADPAAPWIWLILTGVFLLDATVTLVRRAMRGERILQAHRSHAYQWLARRWGSHRRVTVAVLLLDLCWLLPCAAFAALRPDLAALTSLLALTPVAVLAVASGSGRSEASGSR